MEGLEGAVFDAAEVFEDVAGGFEEGEGAGLVDGGFGGIDFLEGEGWWLVVWGIQCFFSCLMNT